MISSALVVRPLHAQAGANAVGPLELPRIGPGYVLDGRPDERAWEGVPILPMVTYEPAYRQAPSQRTEVRVAYDDTSLYVAGHMFESELDQVRRNSFYRDRSGGDDVLGVLVDPFNDNETALWLWTTPNGIRGDALVTGDGGNVDAGWNTHWEVAVESTTAGWFVEMRIPFSSLGFQTAGELAEMGLIVHRDLSSRNERHVFPDISPEFSWRRTSLARDVELRGIESSRPFYLTPYLLTGQRRESRLDPDGARWGTATETPGEFGGDIRYPVTPNLTVDVTANTDFAQVDVDNQQVNLTRFSLFLPERRQFFLERAGIFGFSIGGSDRVFHSRRIGLDDGRPVRILGGVRMAGRVGDWDIGVMDLQTEGGDLTPSMNHGVARVRRRVFNEYSTAGAILTTRAGSDGSYNVAYGLDSQVRWSGNDYFGLRWSQTFDDSDDLDRRVLRESGRDVGALDASLVRVQMWNAVQQGFQYALAGRFVGPRFQPEMGFLLRPDVSEFNSYVAWSKIFGEESRVRRVDPFQLVGNVVVRNDDHSVESALIEYDTDIAWKSGWGLWQDFELRYDDLRDPIAFSGDAGVPAGSYWYFRTEGGLNVPQGARARVPVNWGLQQFYDGMRWNLGVFPTWNVSPHLTLGGQYRLDVVRFEVRDEGFDSHLARLRIQTALDTSLSLTAFLQYSSLADVGSVNARLRYNFSEGRDLWIVYDEGLLLERDHLVPRPPVSSRRTLLLKYTHTFSW